MVELIRTKLSVPRPRANVVSRTRLVERLNGGLGKKLTLIAAPAGFGKTTLLSEWIPSSARCVTWLALDEGDNDPVKFWAYFITCLQGLDRGLGAGALSALQAEHTPPIASILTAMLNEIAAFPDTFSLVLDDYHLIDTEAIHDALNGLLAHLPANMHLVIATRADPPLSLARLRTHDQMTELRANDLRFTADEASEFLGKVMGLRLTPEQVDALEKRTEGWIAGLQIAGLSMRDRDDVAGFIHAFSGSHRHILGYLGEEVLDRQPPATLDFMLKTCLLDRLCGPLCDAVTGETGGQAVLEGLERTNLFLTPLDDAGVWYRYHPLFAEVLVRRASMLRTADIPLLHQRAGDWFEKADLIEEALKHALAARDEERAAGLVERHASRVLAQGKLFVVRGWLEQFPPEALATHPGLVLLQARILGLTGNLDEADRRLSRSAGLFSEPDVSSDLRGELAQVRASLARFRGQLTDSLRYGKEALELLPPYAFDSRAGVLINLSVTYLMLGEPEAARSALEQIIAFGESAAPLLVWRAGVLLAWLDSQKGQLSAAAEAAQRVIRQAASSSLSPTQVLGMAYFILGEIDYERNELENARQSLERAIAHLEITVEQIFLAKSYGTLMRALEANGDGDAALEILKRAQSWLARMQMNDFGFSSILAGEKILFEIRQGKLERAAHRAEGLLNPPGRPSKYARELRDLVLVRVYCAAGEYARALHLLDELQASAERKGWNKVLCEVFCVRAMTLWAQGNSPAASEVLERALALGEAGGYLRMWLDEGEPMRELLVEHKTRLRKQQGDDTAGGARPLATYLEGVLAAFPQAVPGDSSKGDTLLDLPNEREREILRLIAAGYSNREIADRLVIAPSTVKWHINNLYAKLGAKSRTRALALARDMGLL